jgi:hypothetical protein
MRVIALTALTVASTAAPATAVKLNRTWPKIIGLDHVKDCIQDCSSTSEDTKEENATPIEQLATEAQQSVKSLRLLWEQRPQAQAQLHEADLKKAATPETTSATAAKVSEKAKAEVGSHRTAFRPSGSDHVKDDDQSLEVVEGRKEGRKDQSLEVDDQSLEVDDGWQPQNLEVVSNNFNECAPKLVKDGYSYFSKLIEKYHADTIEKYNAYMNVYETIGNASKKLPYNPNNTICTSWDTFSNRLQDSVNRSVLANDFLNALKIFDLKIDISRKYLYRGPLEIKDIDMISIDDLAKKNEYWTKYIEDQKRNGVEYQVLNKRRDGLFAAYHLLRIVKGLRENLHLHIPVLTEDPTTLGSTPTWLIENNVAQFVTNIQNAYREQGVIMEIERLLETAEFSEQRTQKDE